VFEAGTNVAAQSQVGILANVPIDLSLRPEARSNDPVPKVVAVHEDGEDVIKSLVLARPDWDTTADRRQALVPSTQTIALIRPTRREM